MCFSFLQSLYRKVLKARETQSVIVTTPTSLNALFLKFIEILHRLDVREPAKYPAFWFPFSHFVLSVCVLHRRVTSICIMLLRVVYLAIHSRNSKRK